MKYQIRVATPNDLPFLIELEKASFKKERQFTISALKQSLKSTKQTVYILCFEGKPSASATLRLYKKTWRIYSVAALPAHQGKGFGKMLFDYILNLAAIEYITRLTLEVDSTELNLIKWYESFGFKMIALLSNYYGDGKDGIRMELVLVEPNLRLSNLIVTDQAIEWLDKISGLEVINTEQFINEPRFQKEEFRVFNFCSSYAYQTIGYYVSLLASARELRAIPNVATLEDFLDETIIQSIGDEVGDLIRRSFKQVNDSEVTLRVLWGKTEQKRYAPLAHALYLLFPAPLLEFKFVKSRKWRLSAIKALPATEVVADEQFLSDAVTYFQQKRFTTGSFKNYKYDLAILVDPQDPSAPSCKGALTRFKQAAEKVGFYTEFITKEDYHRIPQFDALFIRTTTNVNDYTYQFSRLAYAEGLVVIDDPWSILKCANKLYLHESMNRHGIKTPKTIFVTNQTSTDFIIQTIGFPVVIKRPDSAASRGVFKVHSQVELIGKLQELFISSEIVLAQEYIKSSFDWRVGILDNKALYVCKYLMAKNHWQIYNWSSNQTVFEVGGVETFLVEDAPAEVVAAALEAAAVMGDGFYGVDIKEANGKIYVIEVNDNPSIDNGWEDKLLGNDLYLYIMRHFFTKIEAARNIKRRSSLPEIV